MRALTVPLTGVMLLTLVALSNTARAKEVDAEQLRCLALNVYWEARSESAQDQQAVAHVTLNRVASPVYPKTICGVVHQRSKTGACQFGWACDRKSDTPKERKAWQAAIENAKTALAQRRADPTRGALFFHRTTERPAWAARKQRTVRIGHHIYYK